MRRPRRSAASGDDGWTSEISSALALAGFLFLVFLGFTALAMGPLVSLDAYVNLASRPGGWTSFLHLLDRIGQRAVCLPVLLVVIVVCGRHRRSWRPAWLTAAAVFSVNLLVLILKVGLGRGQPEAANPSFFIGGVAYPSGHTANIMLVYGLAVYLLGRYRDVGRRGQSLLWGVVSVLSVTMVVTSMSLSWHWFADLIAGLLIGAVVLELVIAADAALPATALHRSPLHLLRSVARRPRGAGTSDEPDPAAAKVATVASPVTHRDTP